MTKVVTGNDIIDISRISVTAARLAIVSVIAALLFFVSLHILSPEFDLSWRMVSEYAGGNYSWVLSLMFVSWALGTWALAFAIRSQVRTRAAKIGYVLLIITGIGELLASMFDITSPVHALTDVIGAGFLPIAAILISVSLGRMQAWFAARKLLLWTASLTLLSVVLLIVTLIIEAVTYQNVVGSLPSQVPKSLPPGVIGVSGWANRFLVVTYCAWIILVAWQAIRVRGH